MKGFSGPFKKTYEGEVKSIPREVTPIAREVQYTPSVITNRQEVKSPAILYEKPAPVAYRSSYFKNPTTKQQKLDKKRKLDYKPQSSFKQVNEAGTEDASPGGGTPPPSKPTIKSVQKRIADLKLHKQTNTKEYKNLVAMLNKGYKNQSNNYDEID
tara:strand:+ start:1182 stop:1649 length:468 start_codon:yes stop_codon:yes gene_type:complete